MTLTAEDIQKIVSIVLSALHTNSRTISQLTEVREITDAEYIEIGEGRRVSFETLKGYMSGLTSEEIDFVNQVYKNTIAKIEALCKDSFVRLIILTRDSSTYSVDLPMALPYVSSDNPGHAGVMSAYDKAKLDNCMEYEEINSKISTAKSEAIKAVEDTVGKSEGIAPLNEDGIISERYLPGYVDDVKEFNGFVNTGTLLYSTDKKSTDAMCAVVYHAPSNRFVLRVGLTEYYRDWMDDKAFGTPGVDGVTPIADKMYVDKAANKTYRWSGSQLVELSSGVALGYTSSTAFPGDEGKTLSNEVTGMGQTLMELERDVDDEFKSLNTFKNTVVTKSMVDEENGVCPLDSNTQIPVNNLPSGVPTQEYTYDEVTALLNEI